MNQPVPAPSPDNRDAVTAGATAVRNVREVIAEALPVLHSYDESGNLLLTDLDRINVVTGLLQLRNMIDAITVSHLDALDTGDTIFHEIGVSTRTWLADHERLTPGQATALLKQGRSLSSFATIKRSAFDGEVSLAQAMAMASGLGNLPVEVAPHQVDDAEAHLIAEAAQFNSKELATLSIRVLEVIAPETAEELAQQQLERQLERAQRDRFLKFSDDGHGTTRITGALPTLQARTIETVLGSFAADEHRRSVDNLDPFVLPSTQPQRLADALITVCGRIEHCGEAPSHGGDRPRLVVTVDQAQLLDWDDSTGAREVGADHRLTATELRQLACDAELLPIVLGGDGEILDVGRDHRLVTPAIRAALTVRDRGCIFPGCDRLPVDCEAHHIQPWQAGGPTSFDNLALLCRHHHRTVEPAKDPLDRPRQWQIELHPKTGIGQLIPPAHVDPHRKPRLHNRFIIRR